MLLLDEPTSGIDPDTARGIAAVLVTRQRTEKKTIVSVMHDPALWGDLPKRTLLLDGGKLVTDTDCAEKAHTEEAVQ
jgi:energy-coupling factor transporter ATP-binding protein EcfA2